MASAVAVSKMVVSEVTLTINQDEAETLMTVLAAVAGHPEKSRRKYAQRIFEALRSVGIEYDMSDMHGKVNFEGE